MINRFTFVVFTCVIAFIALFAVPHVSRAQSVEQLAKSYITPFPKNEKYTVYVVGDSLAAGVYKSLEETFQNDRRLQLKSSFKYRSGLARTDAFSWKTHLQRIAKQETVHMVVMLVGLAERRSVRIAGQGKNQKFGSEAWQKTMSGRVGSVLKMLKDKKVAVYWVGLPIMRSPKQNDAMQQLNSIFRQQAFLNGVKFIDTWNGFADQFGRYSAYGADLTGKIRRLRDKDGIQFTTSGFRKLAHFVEREILRDMALAKAERNIPLAGDAKEQERIRTDAKPKIKKRVAKSQDGAEAEGFFSSLQKRLLGISKNTKKQASTNPSVTVIDGLKIVRPPLPDLALSRSVARRNASSSLYGIGTSLIAKNIGSNLTALASVTPANDLSLKTVKQRIPLQQTPYYRVLVLGETLESKPGRADDFTWGRHEDTAELSNSIN